MARKKSTKKEIAQQLFGDKIQIMHGDRKKRMNIIVDDETNAKVRSEAKRMGISITDYITYVAIFFKVDDIPSKLDLTLSKLNLLKTVPKKALKKLELENVKFVKQTVKEYKEGDNDMSEEKQKSKTNHFHLRVTNETHEKIKERASKFSMSISDYVVFTTLHFDVMEISKKIDEINAKIDYIMENGGVDET